MQNSEVESGVDLKELYKDIAIRTPKSSNVDWKIEAESVLDNRDLDTGKKQGADGWYGNDSNYRDMEELSPQELQYIEEINTTQGSLKIMREISLRQQNHDLYSRWGGRPVTERDLTNFETKALPSENKCLSELNAYVNEKITDSDEDRNLLFGNGGVKFSSSKGWRNREKNTRNSIIHPAMRKKKSTYPERDEMIQKSGKMPRKRKRRIQPKLVSEEPEINYEDSELILSGNDDKEISVAKPLADILKPHQKEGVKFMWKNIYEGFEPECSPAVIASVGANLDSVVRGCILAHNM